MKLAIALSLSVMACACGRSTKGAPAAPQGCPFGVPGAQVAVVDTPRGVDVTLTAPTWDGAAEIQWRAHDAAQLYGPGAHEGFGHHGQHLGAQTHGLRLTELPPIFAEVEDIEGGARMHLEAKLESQIAELRERMHARAKAVTGAPCE